MQFAVCSSIQIRAAQTSYAPIANKISNLFLLANSKLELLRLPLQIRCQIGSAEGMWAGEEATTDTSSSHSYSHKLLCFC